MNKLYRKVLIARFDELMKQHFPEFEFEKYDRNPMRSLLDRDYVSKPVPGVRIYISLIPSHKGHDKFNCIISWSKLDRYPEPKPAFYGRDSFDVDEADIPINFLCGEHGLGWEIVRKYVPPPQTSKEMFDDCRGLMEEEAKELIAPLLADVFEKLNREGRPFIQDFIEYVKRGAGSRLD